MICFAEAYNLGELQLSTSENFQLQLQLQLQQNRVINFSFANKIYNISKPATHTGRKQLFEPVLISYTNSNSRKPAAVSYRISCKLQNSNFFDWK